MTAVEKPLDVSVIIPSFNGYTRGFLGDAIKSVLSQTRQPLEIILVDDGSNDGTSQYVENEFREVKVLTQSHRGLSAALNYGINQSVGKYIAFLDDDDLWLPDKLEKQFECLELSQNRVCSLIITGVGRINKRGEVVSVDIIYDDLLNFPELLVTNTVGGPSNVLVSRDNLAKVGLFDENLTIAQDYDLWLKLAKVGRIGIISEPLTLRRWHRDQSTHLVYPIYLATIKILQRHLPEKGSFFQKAQTFTAFDHAFMALARGQSISAVKIFLKARRKHQIDIFLPLILSWAFRRNISRKFYLRRLALKSAVKGLPT